MDCELSNLIQKCEALIGERHLVNFTLSKTWIEIDGSVWEYEASIRTVNAEFHGHGYSYEGAVENLYNEIINKRPAVQLA